MAINAAKTGASSACFKRVIENKPIKKTTIKKAWSGVSDKNLSLRSGAFIINPIKFDRSQLQNHNNHCCQKEHCHYLKNMISRIA